VARLQCHLDQWHHHSCKRMSSRLPRFLRGAKRETCFSLAPMSAHRFPTPIHLCTTFPAEFH
jgi:hypothetical protein